VARPTKGEAIERTRAVNRLMATIRRLDRLEAKLAKFNYPLGKDHYLGDRKAKRNKQ